MKPEEAMKIAQAYARLQQLRNATIKQVADDAEIKGLIEYLAPALLEHASEFIGCYFVMHNEYEPFINTVLPIFRRCLGTLQQQERQYAEAQRTAAVTATGNAAAGQSKIVGLDGNPTEQ